MAEPATARTRPPTLRQERLAEILTDPVNPPKTKREAALKAGYSPTTALKLPGRAIASVGTQSVVEARRARQGDKARGILHAGLEQMAQRMPTAQDQGVAAFTKVAAEIVSSGVVEDHSTSADQERAMRVLRRYGRYCYYLGTRTVTPQDVVVSQLDVRDYQAKARNDAPELGR